MHYCWLRDERLPGFLDVAHQVHMSAPGNRIRSFCRQRRAERALRCVYGQCNLEVVQQVQTQRSQDSRDPECLCRCGSGSRIRKPYWWCPVLFGRDVFLLSFEDHVAKLLLRLGGYGGVGGRSTLSELQHRPKTIYIGHESFLDRSACYV